MVMYLLGFVLGVEVGNEDERDPTVGRHRGEELLERVESAGGCADTGHGRPRRFGLALLRGIDRRRGRFRSASGRLS
jgi:hypothetical protein